MKFTNEISKVFKNICERRINPASPKDVVIPILGLYHQEDEGEDLVLKMFFMENIISEETYNSIIEGIKNLPVLNVKNIMDDIREEVRDYPGLFVMDPDLSRIMGQAEIEQQMYPQGKRGIIFPSHIILAALKVNLSIQKIFEAQGIGYHHLAKLFGDHKEIFEEMNKIMKGITDKKKGDKPGFNPEEWLESMGFPFGDPDNDDDDDDDEDDIIQRPGRSERKGMLGKYARLLGEDNDDPIIGREKEISELLEILGCKKKNNAILIGEAGVGKTAVVELLARKIKNKDVPGSFIGKKIYSLDLNSLVAGTKYRGQYEERLKGIIEEVTSDPNIIVYIDEIHSLVGNGGSEGSGDAANILKPHLARGSFQCIGATTFREYRKFIEKDSALKRRFQNVIIEEPGKEETLNILRGMKKTYEKYHGVQYSKEILEACVNLSGRYLHDRNFPDKAVDAMDLSGSLARLRANPEKDDYARELVDALSEVRKTKCEAVASLDWGTVETARTKEKELVEEIKKQEKTRKEIVKVTLADVEEAVGKRSGVPLDHIGTSDLDKLRKLGKTLKSEVIGQEEAIREVVIALQRNSLGLRDPKRPIANLLFVGNTGTGKTLLCKKLAKEFFGSEDLLLRYDMNEYTDKTGVSKLLGSNPGYVGFDQESGFEAVRKHPYSVVLIDEIDKSTDEIFQLFLNIMDEGKVTLNNGTTVDFKNTIIIFTGNVGTKDLSLFGDGLGYTTSGLTEERKNSIIKKSIEKTFSPEFRNRLTKTVIFRNLTRENLKDIVDLEIGKLKDRLKTSKVRLAVSEKVKELILDSCDLKFGGRDIARNVVKYVEEPICDYLLESDENWTKKKIQVDSEDKKIKISLV
jgi:ATP-dependent Clp protease ATP-binding subunit ClpC